MNEKYYNTRNRPIRFGYYLLGRLMYFVVRFGMPITIRLEGYKRSTIGKCVILAPPKQMQIILEGAKFLEAIDPSMFQQVTAERRYVFWYHPTRFVSCREIFTVTDNFLLWGKEGVAICFVQSVLDFTWIRLPFEKALTWCRENTIAAHREVQQQVFKWISDHSFPAELLKQYKEISKEASRG